MVIWFAVVVLGFHCLTQSRLLTIVCRLRAGCLVVHVRRSSQPRCRFQHGASGNVARTAELVRVVLRLGCLQCRSSLRCRAGIMSCLDLRSLFGWGLFCLRVPPRWRALFSTRPRVVLAVCVFARQCARCFVCVRVVLSVRVVCTCARLLLSTSEVLPIAAPICTGV